MSGGSMGRLYKQRNPTHYDLRMMARWFREHQFEDEFEEAAAATDFMVAEAELRELWKAVEWFDSGDWVYEEILVALEHWNLARGGVSHGDGEAPPQQDGATPSS